MSRKAFVSQSFGKYFLVERIASGGMAEVFKATLAGPGGFEKPVAIKKILSLFGDDPEFIDLFMDEGRICSTLDHANIAQVFELGQVDRAFYLAMELVDGADLAKLTLRLANAGQPMPIAAACHIAAEAARGLAYAHTRTDSQGRPLGIVHRDVSPANILVSFAGDVKLVDFGIAKAAGKLHKTATGVVMGKLRYMSPEQVDGGELDAQSDIYSLGVVLYEQLVGGPRFRGEQGLRLAEMIRAGAIEPPSRRNPDVPPELDRIVARALAKEKRARYPRASELARDLSRFIATTAPGFTREDVAALVQRFAARSPEELALAEPAVAIGGGESAGEIVVGANLPERPERPPVRDGLVRSSTEMPVSRRGGMSASTKVGLFLGAVVIASVSFLAYKFVIPGHDAPPLSGGDAAVLTPPHVDAGPAPIPKAPFTLVPTATAEQRRELAAKVDAFDVTRRGVPAADYAAFLTALDCKLAALALDTDGKATAAPDLPPRVAAAVARANVGDAVDAVVEYVRATGELPPLVKSAARQFLADRASVSAEPVNSPGGLLPPFSAAAIAVWLEPSPRRLVELAYANDVLGRWCPTPAEPARHFAPQLCERAALVSLLQKTVPKDIVGAALQRWDQATGLTSDDGGTMGVDSVVYHPADRPDEYVVTVTLTAPPPGPTTLLAATTRGGLAVNAQPESPTTFVVPRVIVAPVIKVGETTLKIAPPPWGGAR